MVGLWDQVAYDYGDSAGSAPQPVVSEPGPAAEPDMPKQTITVMVWSENGKPVNLRKRPDKAAALVDRFPAGTDAELLESGPLWSRIRVKGKTGWMMTEFLVTDESAEPVEEDSPEVSYSVTIFGLDLTQANALHSCYPGSVIERSVG